ncbi:MAG: acetyltransferase [Cryomorphaceae bacterium]|nr:acetyltransferase [Cryomorphaceae bacterium]
MQNVVIYGAGGFGREVHSMLKASSLGFHGFVDDKLDNVLGNGHWLGRQSELHVILANGNSHERRRMYHNIQKAAHHFPNVIHPNATLQDTSTIKLGKGIIITSGCTLTTSIVVGDFSILNLHTTVGHDVCIGQFVSIMPAVNLGGGVVVEDDVYIGTNATVLPFIRVGKGAVIGAGAVVTKDVPPGVTVKGIPAKQQ